MQSHGLTTTLKNIPCRRSCTPVSHCCSSRCDLWQAAAAGLKDFRRELKYCACQEGGGSGDVQGVQPCARAGAAAAASVALVAQRAVRVPLRRPQIGESRRSIGPATILSCLRPATVMLPYCLPCRHHCYCSLPDHNSELCVHGKLQGTIAGVGVCMRMCRCILHADC